MKNSKTKIVSTIIYWIIFLSTSAAYGYGIAKICDFNKLDAGQIILCFAVSLIYFYVAIMFHATIHEAGHLVFGLKSGYKFNSFRVGSFMWKKENDKVVLKRFTLAGTGGQCLLSPPELVDGKMPFIMYNLGGVVFNLIAVAIMVPITASTRNIELLCLFFYILVLVGLYLTLINGIPLTMNGMDNDGMNIVSLSKDELAVKAMWVQLKANEHIANNKSIKDMPDEWLELPENANMNNALISSVAIFKCNKLMAEKNFDEAKMKMKEILDSDWNIVGIYKSLLKIDMAYIEMIKENKKNVVDGFIGDMEKKIISAMKNYPTIIRFQYTYALLVEKNEKKAKEFREHIEKIVPNYPYKVDIEDEMSLMDYADKVDKEV